MSIDDALRAYAHQLTVVLRRRHLRFSLVNASNDNWPSDAA